ncbi:endonuclease I family protein [Actinoplanes sp. L3-i22]|uniref:endonuclease I family protein n=1 Tax=Actinoplanes sp. L3-i22 TaxID=2836373 RepID=UPI001C764465|nr:endonuclease [Actinoplanes sp. L3-i22]BCY11204.1 extracellular ribonuclease [Actinoplanes sp. L3-i22]
MLATTLLMGVLAAGVPQSPAVAAEGDYYAAARGLHGAALKETLHDIISSRVTTLSYGKVWDALEETDRDPANSRNVIGIYSGRSMPWTNHGGGGNQWNREHVWAKSHGDFGTAPGPGTDVHHLRPENVLVNSERSNLDFDEGGHPARYAPNNNLDDDSWEPRDEAKGDVARMIFYMAVRWEGDAGSPDLEPDDRTSRGKDPRIGRISALLEWNDEDPPDAFEKNRNEVIYQHWQHNRNPFIDHPEWVDDIY